METEVETEGVTVVEEKVEGKVEEKVVRWYNLTDNNVPVWRRTHILF